MYMCLVSLVCGGAGGSGSSGYLVEGRYRHRDRYAIVWMVSCLSPRIQGWAGQLGDVGLVWEMEDGGHNWDLTSLLSEVREHVGRALAVAPAPRLQVESGVVMAESNMSNMSTFPADTDTDTDTATATGIPSPCDTIPAAYCRYGAGLSGDGFMSKCHVRPTTCVRRGSAGGGSGLL